MIGIIHENQAYWTGRAATYSEVNQMELSGNGRVRWSNTLQEKICSHFPNREPKDIRVLEIGTGPGFFAILMAEAGYRVTAVDLTPSMLDEARRNAGSLAGRIDFRQMNAESLSFPDASFDVILSRNLTWNLPHPEKAYREWHRVLRPGGMLLNFDANWYHYLFDRDAKERYEKDRENTRSCGIKDENIGERFDVMEDIARRIPLSRISRPDWDHRILSELDFRVRTDPSIWKRVWSPEEKINFASTPMFLVQAVK